MNVLQLCDPEAAAVPVEASVGDAIRKMLDYHVGAVGVVDGQGRVAGIFTERDVLRKPGQRTDVICHDDCTTAFLPYGLAEPSTVVASFPATSTFSSCRSE